MIAMDGHNSGFYCQGTSYDGFQEKRLEGMANKLKEEEEQIHR
jgi:hypothetical protein